MRVYYDLHIHSALSPCGDEDMTPLNIVGMAKLIGLDVIAVTDHNSVGNCRAVIEAGKDCDLLVIPGMELETSEEVHIVMLFRSIEGAEACGREVKERLLKIDNDEEIYGEQLYLDCNDTVVGKESNLLVTATNIGVYEVVELAKKYGGIAIPAHIDRTSHGILQMLGDIDEYMNFTAVEITPNASDEFVESWRRRGYEIVRNSDAHYLHNLNEKTVNFLEVENLCVDAVIDALERR